ncbi:MAG TPA: 4Fe-4S binding protein [Thermoplasmata archaeon]|mgnify:CR=1 FL=1|nr:4Fe-4S binding protein [Thermoplasmata archaeon]
MKFTMFLQLLAQIFKKPGTNPFPKKYAPKSMNKLLKSIDAGKEKINPPVPVPPKFRGRIGYDKEKCTCCKLCQRVCPAHAIDVGRTESGCDFRIYAARCIACAQCVDICPTNALSMREEFLFATYDKYGKDMIIE